MCYEILHHFNDIPDFFSVRIINILNRLAGEILNTSSIPSSYNKLVKQIYYLL